MGSLTRLYALAGGLAVIGYFALVRGSDLGHLLVYDSIGLSSVAAIAFGIVRNEPERRRAWIALGIGTALFVVGDQLWTIEKLMHGSVPYPSPADAVYVCAYPFLAWGVFRLAPNRDRRESRIALIDAAIFSVAATFALWIPTLDPLIHDGTGVTLAHLFALAYPIGDLVLVGMLLRLAFQAGRTTWLTLLLLWGALLLTGDTLYVTPATSNAYSLGSVTDACWLLSYLALGATALSPSIKRCLRCGALAARWRFLVLGAALLTFPLAVLGESARDGGIADPYVFGVGAAALAVLVVARLAAVTAEARESEQRFKSVFDASPIGVSFGNDGYMTHTNRAFQEMLGYTAEELARLNYLEVTHPDDVPNDVGLAEQLPSPGEKLVLEKRYVRKDGEVVWARVHITLSPDSGFGIGLIEDITAHRRLEEQLRESSKLEAVGELAAGIAHDFNNLMTVVVGYSDAILRDPSRKLEWRVREIRAAGERAAALTRQLLTFSRRQHSRPEVVDLGLVLEDLEPLLQRIVGDAVDLRARSTPEAFVLADHAQLGQVLMNLAINAREAMPDGGTLELAVDRENGEVVLTAADTGVGMTPQVIDHIFEPFFTTKNRAVSTGLGLATVYGVVSQGGGRIEVDSEPGEGTTFRLVFPRVGEPATAPEPVAA